MKQITTALVMLSAAAGLFAEPLKITATMTDDTQVEIEFEDESQYYHHVVEAEEGTGNLMTVIYDGFGSDDYQPVKVFEMPVSRMKSFRRTDTGAVGTVMEEPSAKCSCKDGVLTLVSPEQSTMLSIAAPDGTLIMKRSVTTETTVNLSDFGTGVRIIRFGEANFKILVSK